MKNKTTNKSEQELFNERMNAWLETAEAQEKISKAMLNALKRVGAATHEFSRLLGVPDFEQKREVLGAKLIAGARRTSGRIV